MGGNQYQSVGEAVHPSFSHKGPRYWQDAYLRSRTPSNRLVYPEPLLASTPIRKEANHNGIDFVHRPETFYYNFPPPINPRVSGSSLTHVLATYAPGATVLYMDSKEKPTVRVSLGLRRLCAALICLILLGGTAAFCFTDASSSLGDGMRPRSSARGINESSGIPLPHPLKASAPKILLEKQQHTPSPTSNIYVKEPMESQLDLSANFSSTIRTKQNTMSSNSSPKEVPVAPKTKVIYSFDDNDNDDEAIVETLW